MPPVYRQEVINVLMAQLLQERGVASVPESILRIGAAADRRIPDVIVHYQGLRTAIEGEYGFRPDARSLAETSARSRVGQGIAHIGIAVVYPPHLREMEFSSVKEELAQCELEICIVTESQSTGFVKGSMSYLDGALRHAFEQLIREDVVDRAVGALRAGIEEFAQDISHLKGIQGRIAATMGIRELPPETIRKRRTDGEHIAISRIGGLVLINAMIFQEILSEYDSRVMSLQQALVDTAPARTFAHHWQLIIAEINYYPIFHLACQILLDLTAGQTSALRRLGEAAHTIVGERAALRHDLMGRVYHKLLVDAKYLGTYYTSIPAATLLLKLALAPGQWPLRWDQAEALGEMRIADLSCGTGTLLMAAADALTDNHINAAIAAGEPPDFDLAQKKAAENILHGYDVLLSAIHLTASTLALRSPGVTFNRMNLFCLPLGGKEARLGSIEYMLSNTIQMEMDLFGIPVPRAQRITAEGREEILLAAVPDLDLCVMNPPFTRSVGGNLLFGSAPQSEREAMQRRLKGLVGAEGVLANITAGLGSVFVATAHPFIKKGGRIALVLPKALLSGAAWDPTRQLLRQYYQVEHIVASHDPNQWNFSESTDLSEVLIVARKKGNGLAANSNNVSVLNLWRNPRNSFESLAVSEAILKQKPPDIASGQGSLEIRVGDSKMGEALLIPWSDLEERYDWMLPCAFAQSDLIRAAWHLLKGNLWLPGHGIAGRVRLCPLGKLGELGPDRRDIHDGFEPTDTITPYPALWGHDAASMRTLAQAPNRHLAPRHKAQQGRHLRKVEDLWPLAGKVMIAERLWLKTQSLMAMRLTKPALSNVWWPFTLKKDGLTARREKSLILWLNSTLGLTLMLAYREETRGSWIDFKKPTLRILPVLDLQALTNSQSRKMAEAYDQLAKRPLSPFPKIGIDPVRKEIDRHICQILRIPEVESLRLLLSHEPILTQEQLR